MGVYNLNDLRIPEDAVYIGRGSKWGNPFKIGIHGNRDEVINRYITEVIPLLPVHELRGKSLKCYCKPKRCHGDALLEFANSW